MIKTPHKTSVNFIEKRYEIKANMCDIRPTHLSDKSLKTMAAATTTTTPVATAMATKCSTDLNFLLCNCFILVSMMTINVFLNTFVNLLIGWKSSLKPNEPTSVRKRLSEPMIVTKTNSSQRICSNHINMDRIISPITCTLSRWKTVHLHKERRWALKGPRRMSGWFGYEKPSR